MRGSRWCIDIKSCRVVSRARASSLFLSLSFLLLSASLFPPSIYLSSSYRHTLPLAIKSLFIGEYVRGNLDLNYSQFSLSHFQLFLASPGLVESRADDVSNRVSISRLSRNRGYLPLLNRPHGAWTERALVRLHRFDRIDISILARSSLYQEFVPCRGITILSSNLA